MRALTMDRKNSEWQNQHDDAPYQRQGGYLNMDSMKSMKSKISMMMAPADVREGT